MYKYDSIGLPVTKRLRRQNLEYLRLYDERELKEFEDKCYAYCPESGILIICDFGRHWEAMQEHLADFVEERGWVIADEGDEYIAREASVLTDAQLSECERFLLNDLVLYSIYSYSGSNPTNYFISDVNLSRVIHHKPEYKSSTD